jgi:hypothetical protein
MHVKMGFADVARTIPRVAQIGHERARSFRKMALVRPLAVVVTVQPRKTRGPSGHADRTRRVKELKTDTFLRDAIQIRGLYVRMSGNPKTIRTLLIGHQDENIGLIHREFLCLFAPIAFFIGTRRRARGRVP